MVPSGAVRADRYTRWPAAMGGRSHQPTNSSRGPNVKPRRSPVAREGGRRTRRGGCSAGGAVDRPRCRRRRTRRDGSAGAWTSRCPRRPRSFGAAGKRDPHPVARGLQFLDRREAAGAARWRRTRVAASSLRVGRDHGRRRGRPASGRRSISRSAVIAGASAGTGPRGHVGAAAADPRPAALEHEHREPVVETQVAHAPAERSPGIRPRPATGRRGRPGRPPRAASQSARSSRGPRGGRRARGRRGVGLPPAPSGAATGGNCRPTATRQAVPAPRDEHAAALRDLERRPPNRVEHEVPRSDVADLAAAEPRLEVRDARRREAPQVVRRGADAPATSGSPPTSRGSWPGPPHPARSCRRMAPRRAGPQLTRKSVAWARPSASSANSRRA